MCTMRWKNSTCINALSATFTYYPVRWIFVYCILHNSSWAFFKPFQIPLKEFSIFPIVLRKKSKSSFTLIIIVYVLNNAFWMGVNVVSLSFILKVNITTFSANKWGYPNSHTLSSTSLKRLVDPEISWRSMSLSITSTLRHSSSLSFFFWRHLNAKTSLLHADPKAKITKALHI